MTSLPHSPVRFCYALVLITILISGCDGYSKEQNREMQRIRNMVSADPAAVNRPDNTGNTPLHLAVLNNYLPLMDWLKAHGADPNSRSRYGDTPLHTAIISNRTSYSVIRNLVLMGADVNATNDYGDTPLHRAAYHGLTPTVRYLLSNKADVAKRANRGETALMYAARPEGYPETVSALLEGGADANQTDNFGMTALHGAAMIGDVDVGRVLIEKGAADVNKQTLVGYTPLHVAALFGKTEFVRFLLEKGANRNLHDKANLTPADRAARFPAVSSSKEGKQVVDTSGAVSLLKTYEQK